MKPGFKKLLTRVKNQKKVKNYFIIVLYASLSTYCRCLFYNTNCIAAGSWNPPSSDKKHHLPLSKRFSTISAFNHHTHQPSDPVAHGHHGKLGSSSLLLGSDLSSYNGLMTLRSMSEIHKANNGDYPLPPALPPTSAYDRYLGYHNNQSEGRASVQGSVASPSPLFPQYYPNQVCLQYLTICVSK